VGLFMQVLGLYSNSVMCADIFQSIYVVAFIFKVSYLSDDKVVTTYRVKKEKKV
jgi:hypothetical protein